MKSKHFKFGKWLRGTTKKGQYFFKGGKRVAESKWIAANNRRKSKVVTIFVESVSEKAKKAVGKTEHKKRELALCILKDRNELYEQIKSDRRTLFNKLSDEEFSALRIIVEIGNGKIKNKRGQISEQGTRSFIDLRKFKNFLGLNYKYSDDATPNWGKLGLCKFQKKVYLTVRRLRGERIIGEKIIKRYAIAQP